MLGVCNQMKICVFLILLFLGVVFLFSTVFAEDKYEVFSYAAIQVRIEETEMFLRYNLKNMEHISEHICTFANGQNIYDRLFFKIDADGIYNIETEEYLIVGSEDYAEFIPELEKMFPIVYCKTDAGIVEFRKPVCVDNIEGKRVYGDICLSNTPNKYHESWDSKRIIMPTEDSYWYLSFIPYE